MDPRILRESLETVLAMDDKFPRRFYEILFERHPQVSSLFVRSSAGAQQKMFAQKLCAIVDHVEDAEWMTRELERMRVAPPRCSRGSATLCSIRCARRSGAASPPRSSRAGASPTRV